MSRIPPAIASPPPIRPRRKDWKADLLSGFLVILCSLTASVPRDLPTASRFPAISGIWTAVMGGIVCTLFSNSELTIKGSGAGMIVIVQGWSMASGNELDADLRTAQRLSSGYKLTLGIGVTAGLIQVVLGLIKAATRRPRALTDRFTKACSPPSASRSSASELFVMAGMKMPPGEPIHAILDLYKIFEELARHRCAPSEP